jgi:hypothetical protein
MLWNISLDKDGDFILSEQGTIGIRFKEIFEEDNPCAYCEMLKFNKIMKNELGNRDYRGRNLCPASQEVLNAPILIAQAQHRLGVGEEVPHPNAENVMLCNVFSYSDGVQSMIARIAQHRLDIKKKRG